MENQDLLEQSLKLSRNFVWLSLEQNYGINNHILFKEWLKSISTFKYPSRHNFQNMKVATPSRSKSVLFLSPNRKSFLCLFNLKRLNWESSCFLWNHKSYYLEFRGDFFEEFFRLERERERERERKRERVFSS